MAKVFITGEILTKGLDLLKEHFEVSVLRGEKLITKEELIENVKDADSIISSLSTNIDKGVIDQAENLKFIANYGAGFSNIDVKYAREKGIDVTNTPKA